MKKREIFLDFTSLLDVTLIVIFFFVLFSHLDSQANQARTDEKVKEYGVKIQQAEKRESNARELEEQLHREIEIVTETNERQGENNRELIEFNRGDNIKIIMYMKEPSWCIKIVKDIDVLKVVEYSDDFAENVKKAFENAGYNPENTIMCEFIYDGSKPGSASAYRIVEKAFSEIRRDYHYLYISETDSSIGEE